MVSNASEASRRFSWFGTMFGISFLRIIFHLFLVLGE